MCFKLQNRCVRNKSV
uniref:Uncharacterized protein n=1 Tax=Arundo donax TaxID=35708 RepID=A0A0A8Y2U4_ARUDO